MSSQSMRIVPASSHPTATTNTQSSKLNGSSSSSSTTSRGAPSAPGLPDTLRLSQQTPTSTSTTSAPQLTSTHPLESRLSNWQSTQSSLQSTILRRTFGIALPLRMAMEKNMVSTSDHFRPSVLGPASGVHGDILRNRDASLDWEDVYAGQDGLRGVVDRGGDGQGVGWTEEVEGFVRMGRW